MPSGIAIRASGQFRKAVGNGQETGDWKQVDQGQRFEQAKSQAQCMLLGSHVIKEGHEAKIHVQLLMTMKESGTGVVRHEIHSHLLVASQHHYVLEQTCCRSSSYAYELKTVTVQMNRV